VSVTNLVNTDSNEPETVRTDNVPAVQPPRDSQLLRQAGHPFLVFRHRIHHERNRLQGRVLRRRGSALKRIVHHLDVHVAIIVVHAFCAQYVDDYLRAEIKGWTEIGE
jgi:hypothetical protein